MSNQNPIYLDFNSTTPVDQRVADEIIRFLVAEFGNEGSRTHFYGAKAKAAVQGARERLGSIFGVEKEDVVFTSGATESCNLAILGLAKWGAKNGKKHLICSEIEHKAVLEPIQYLQTQGFEVDYIKTQESGLIDVDHLRKILRKDTLLVAVMASNNETGIIQPIEETAKELTDHDCYFFCDASQAVAKNTMNLKSSRLDIIAFSGHKIFGPKGTGVLLLKRRGFKRPPIEPITFGGGQERGLRPGTLAVPGIMGLVKATELGLKEEAERHKKCLEFRKIFLNELAILEPKINGDPRHCMAHVLNVSFPGINSEAAIVALKEIVAISNGSACTSSSYTLSHVLVAMGLEKSRIQEALRFSWSYFTPQPEWGLIISALKSLR
jgi:cysteine desulfurase